MAFREEAPPTLPYIRTSSVIKIPSANTRMAVTEATDGQRTPPDEVDEERRSIAVIYVALEQFGLAPFRDFVNSYRTHVAGVTHELVILFKGFCEREAASRYQDLLVGVSYHSLFLEDGGYDLGSYFKAVGLFKRDVYCFMNSRSVILVDGWLEMLYRYAKKPEVGMVSATGSMESLYTDYLAIRDRCAGPGGRIRQFLRGSFINRMRHRFLYPAFPNPHLRTNAIAVRREILLQVHRWPFRSKRDTAQFENGRHSISRQLLSKGYELLVVGRNGMGYPPADWFKSNTFWQGTQENLLVADNQTERYALATPREQLLLSCSAWGCSQNPQQ